MRLGIEPTIEDDVTLEEVKLGVYTQIQAHSVLHDCVIGDYSYCAGYNQIYYTTIGKFCSIASHVRINPGNHPSYTRAAQHHFTYRSSMFGFGEDDATFFEWRKENAVKIGNDVWVGHSAIIMPGVNIGNGAIIGAGAVVTKDVAPYMVVAGVPAKFIKYRFDEEICEKLEQIAWWDWSHDKIKEYLEDFKDINAFVQRHSND